MTDFRIENLNIMAEEPIITPSALKEQYPLTDKGTKTILDGQNTVKRILHKKDDRLLVIVGPCSIHDIKSGKEYAQKLKKLADEVSDSLYLVMRVYFEKPRTTVGWQGFINDPYLDNTCHLEDGLKMARELLLYIADLGLPAAGEALDIVTPQYIQDMFSWTAIGARTTESQSHRNMASGLSSAVGFKNGTKGSIDIAINACKSVAAPHNFISIDPNGHVAVVKTKGNINTHIILRGGKEPNYSANHIKQYESDLREAGLEPRIMVDCSHANSGKKAKNQSHVLNSITNQLQNGNSSIMGAMIESNINPGSQKLNNNTSSLTYGTSITDECIGWEDTESLLRELRLKLKAIKH